HFPVDTFSEQLPPLEAALQPFIHGVFHREQPWLVFSPHALAQHQGFLDVAGKTASPVGPVCRPVS
ncbi:hypothetical protein JJP79_24000, partial [Enterobacter hormaechei]|nr:hypothetical protein [Enterobacter hormaechei]